MMVQALSRRLFPSNIRDRNPTCTGKRVLVLDEIEKHPWWDADLNSMSFSRPLKNKISAEYT